MPSLGKKRYLGELTQIGHIDATRQKDLTQGRRLCGKNMQFGQKVSLGNKTQLRRNDATQHRQEIATWAKNINLVKETLWPTINVREMQVWKKDLTWQKDTTQAK